MKRTTARRILLGGVLRGVVLVIAANGAAWADRVWGSGDPLGAGMSGFAAVMMLSGAGGLIDGLRHPFAAVLPRWLVAWVAYVVGSSAVWLWRESRLAGPWPELGQLVSDLVGLAAFDVILVLGPALGVAALTRLVASGGDSARRSRGPGQVRPG